MKLVDELHAYVWQGRDNNCNTYVFQGALADDRHVVVDPGHVTTGALGEPGLDRLREGMRADGLDPEAIGLVLLTHCHPDHCESANTLREDHGTLVAIHENEADILRRFGGEVDIALSEGDLTLDEPMKVQLRILLTPGHSPGHVCVHWPAGKVLIAGDLIFFRNTGRVDLPGGDPRALVESIERMSELDLDYVLCGHPYGHPGVIEGREAVRENFEFLRANVMF